MPEIRLADMVSKSGEITAVSQRVGGVLKPQQASRVIDLIVSGSEILKQVTVERSSRLEREVDVFDLAQEVLVRVPEGSDLSNFVGITNNGCTLHMLPAQLFGRILFSTLRDNKDDPQFENKTLQRWAKRYSENITRLAFVGASDSYTNSAFSELNKGWIQLFKDSQSTHIVDLSSYQTDGVTDWIDYLTAIVAALPDKYKSTRTCKVLMNTTDHEAYVTQVGNLTGAHAVLISGNVTNILGYEILSLSDIPSGTVLFTPLANLIYGINTSIERYREVKGSKRCIDYTFDMNFDFQVAIPDAAVLGYDVPTPETPASESGTGTESGGGGQ